jgi:Leucine-rich repeat (LRR) protein
MILLCITVIITLLPAINVQAEDTVVNFPDSNLEACIRQAINIPDGAIYQTDLEQLTSFWAHDVDNLSGLEYCVNLTQLSLGGHFTDLSPLSGLTKLTSLTFHYGQQVTDLSPLSGLTEMEHLDLWMSDKITDFSPLSGMTKMKDLNLDNTNISDLSPLAGMTEMTDLRARYTQIKDISALSGLTKLHYLGIRNNQITDISALANNSGLDASDFVSVAMNYLDIDNPNSMDMINIRNLQDRDVDIYYNDQYFAWESIAVSPSSPANLDINSTMQFTATGIFSYDSTRDATNEASWSSSDPTVATIDATGLVTSLSAGTTNITASLDSIISSPITLTVSSSPLQSIEQLILEVQKLNSTQGITNSLDAKLLNVKDSLEAANSGNRNDAINKMQAFINACQAQIGKSLSTDQANMLIEKANKIIANLQMQ